MSNAHCEICNDSWVESREALRWVDWPNRKIREDELTPIEQIRESQMKLEDREDVREMLATKVKIELAKCTEKQIVFFHRMYPEGVDGIETASLPHALDQCERTVKKNEIRVAKGDQP